MTLDCQALVDHSWPGAPFASVPVDRPRRPSVSLSKPLSLVSPSPSARLIDCTGAFDSASPKRSPSAVAGEGCPRAGRRATGCAKATRVTLGVSEDSTAGVRDDFINRRNRPQSSAPIAYATPSKRRRRSGGQAIQAAAPARPSGCCDYSRDHTNVTTIKGVLDLKSHDASGSL